MRKAKTEHSELVYSVNARRLISEEGWTVNSEHTYTAFVATVKKLWLEKKYLTFSPPRIGPDRSIDQNSLFHVWLTEYAAHLLNKDKKQVVPGEVEGMKRFAKEQYYLEYKYPWMVHKVICPKTGRNKTDYTSSKKYGRNDMYYFLCWLQGLAAQDGLVLESKGEHEKIHREHSQSVA